MKLTFRIVVVTAGTAFFTAALAGLFLVRMERQQLVADALSESRVFTRSLQVAVENALRDGQTPDVAELLGRLEIIARRVDVYVYEGNAMQPRLASEGSDPSDATVLRVLRQVQLRDETHEVFQQDSEPRLVAGVALRGDDGTRMGTLVVSRPLVELQADLRATTRVVAGFVVLFALATTLIMLSFLQREVLRPLSRIAAAAERLGTELEAVPSLPPERSEELEALRATLLRVREQLLAAREARAREALERERIERQLREADKLIAVGQLAAGVAHEVGSPLQVLVGRAGLLARSTEHSDEVRRQARLIEEQGARIAGIVDRLQGAARRRPSRLAWVDLREPLRQVGWLLEPEAARRGLTLCVELPAVASVAWADPDEVQQIALNLVFNALHASGPGGRVTVALAVETEAVVLRVVDDGVGMEPSVQDRLFEPFFTTRADEGGTGLGLAVVHSIVDRHRARIEVESEPGVGTVVRVFWRREEA